MAHLIQFLVVISGMLIGITACQRPAPAERPAVTLSAYSGGDASIGKQQFDQDCGKCHRLKPGSNDKGPQLSRIYGAAAGGLVGYPYSDALKNSHFNWTPDKLDSYIANPKQAIPETKMKSDPISDPKERQNIIAYLSTLR